MLQYSGKECLRECRLCKSFYKFFEVENTETQAKYWGMMDLHRTYLIPDEERGMKEAFVCKSCVSFIESIVDHRIKQIKSSEKVKVKDTDGK